MSSNVGSASVYEAKDQRTSKDGENQPERFEEGESKSGSHKSQDAKDERSIANRLEKETKKDEDDGKTEKDRIREQIMQDATLPARSHGNQPSKGAIIDQEIQEEEAAILAKKGSFGPAASN